MPKINLQYKKCENQSKIKIMTMKYAKKNDCLYDSCFFCVSYEKCGKLIEQFIIIYSSKNT